MSAFTLTDAYIVVNGVTLSDHANQVKVTDMRDQKEATAFGAGNKTYLKGFGDCTIDVTFFQDFASGKTYATLQPLIASNTPVTVEVRATSAARSATNVAFVMSALLTNFNPIDGNAGDVSMTQATFINGSSTGLQYLTS